MFGLPFVILTSTRFYVSSQVLYARNHMVVSWTGLFYSILNWNWWGLIWWKYLQVWISNHQLQLLNLERNFPIINWKWLSKTTTVSGVLSLFAQHHDSSHTFYVSTCTYLLPIITATQLSFPPQPSMVFNTLSPPPHPQSPSLHPHPFPITVIPLCILPILNSLTPNH